MYPTMMVFQQSSCIIINGAAILQSNNYRNDSLPCKFGKKPIKNKIAEYFIPITKPEEEEYYEA